MAKIIFDDGEQFTVEDGAPIRDACEDAGVPFACSGGICGACIVGVSKGMENLSEPTQAELNFLGEDGVKQERMACQCSIKRGEVSIKR